MNWYRTSDAWPTIGIEVMVVKDGELAFAEVGYSTMDGCEDTMIWKCYPTPTHWAYKPKLPDGLKYNK